MVVMQLFVWLLSPYLLETYTEVFMSEMIGCLEVALK